MKRIFALLLLLLFALTGCGATPEEEEEAIEEVIEGIYVVNDRAQYDDNIGLRLDNHWLNEILTI